MTAISRNQGESVVRILVTGGTGYVGSVSVERLLAAGHYVVVLDNLSTGHRAAADRGAGLVVSSYGDGAAVTALLEREGIEAILHCGARSLVGESVADPATYYRENVTGGLTLLDAAGAAGVRRLVFSSSAAVYGEPDVTPIGEDAALAPINPYGETKRMFEGALRWYGAAYGLRSVSLRYFNVAGASERNGEDHDPETHLIPNVLRAAEGAGPLTVYGTDYPTPDGTCVRDYIHVEDLADAHLAALEATAAGDPRTTADDDRARAIALNLGSASGFSVRAVIAAAEQVVGARIPVSHGPRRAGDPPILVAANDRARKVLGWMPQRGTLEAMIGSAWAWRRRNRGGYRA
jgi:UDP-glucose-4-epimerase GalE